MPVAFILINTEVGSEEHVMKQLDEIEIIKEAYIVYGVYDIIVKAEAETMSKLKDTITEKIRKIELVRSTLTMIQT